MQPCSDSKLPNLYPRLGKGRSCTHAQRAACHTLHGAAPEAGHVLQHGVQRRAPGMARSQSERLVGGVHQHATRPLGALPQGAAPLRELRE